MAVTAFSYIDMHVAALDLKQLSSKYLTKTIGFQFIKYIKFATLESDFHRFLQISSNGNVDQFIFIFFKECFFTHSHIDTGCKLNVHKMFRRHPGRFLNVFYVQFTSCVYGVCYLKHALFRLEDYPGFSRKFLCGQRYRLEDTKRNALNITDFRN